MYIQRGIQSGTVHADNAFGKKMFFTCFVRTTFIIWLFIWGLLLYFLYFHIIIMMSIKTPDVDVNTDISKTEQTKVMN